MLYGMIITTAFDRLGKKTTTKIKNEGICYIIVQGGA